MEWLTQNLSGFIFEMLAVLFFWAGQDFLRPVVDSLEIVETFVLI